MGSGPENIVAELAPISKAAGLALKDKSADSVLVLLSRLLSVTQALGGTPISLWLSLGVDTGTSQMTFPMAVIAFIIGITAFAFVSVMFPV